MKELFLKRIPLLLILLITLIFSKLQANKLSGGENEVCTTICSDGRGYYAWLPALFIYHDLNFNFFDHNEVTDTLCGGKVEGCLQDYRSCHDGVPCNKYYPGAAFMMLPMFALAHFMTLHSVHYQPDGYSYLYFKLAGLSGILFYMIGMLFFLKLLQHLRLTTLQQSLTILLITFGSNIMYYAIDKPTYSHIYSFTLIAAFLWYAFSLTEKYSPGKVLLLTFIGGWIFITRPVNVSVFLILPFIFRQHFPQIKASIRLQPLRVLLLAPGLIMPMVLFVMYKIATGHFFIYSYGNEGFNFLHPELWRFMSDYNNGVFAYMPLLMMPVLLLPLWYKKSEKRLISGSLLTILAALYIHSSWYCWWYGFSFGARTMLDFVPVYGLLIALSLRDTPQKRYAVLLPVYFLSAGITIILYHQKNHGFLNSFPIDDYRDAIFNAIGIKGHA
jgi:hypothetical protein